MPSPPGRYGALAASLRRVPRSLAHPVVLTFLVAAYFSYVTGDTVRAGYLLAVGLALAWDQAHRRVRRASPGPSSTRPASPGAASSAPAGPGPASSAPAGPGPAGPGPAGPGQDGPGQLAFSHESADRRRAVMRRWVLPAAAAGLVYSVAVGSLHRYSWPATIAVNVPAVAGVLLAWRASSESAGEPGRLRPGGIALWALIWVGASVLELASLYLQPSLDTDSYAHPTLSYLADSVLASAPGRSVVLFAWLAFGWYLARR